MRLVDCKAGVFILCTHFPDLEQCLAYNLGPVIFVDYAIPEHKSGEVPKQLLVQNWHSFVMSMLGRQRLDYLKAPDEKSGQERVEKKGRKLKREHLRARK